MTRLRLIFLLLGSLTLSLAADPTVPVAVRGKVQNLVRLSPASPAVHVKVIFLPGDGGWRGAAIDMANAISALGYEVYGFDTKKYLETFSQNGLKLSQDQLALDMRFLAAQLGGNSGEAVILVGWSQGAGMAVAAASGSHARQPIQGILTVGLPESAVLGWDWKATLAIIARREPDQPSFLVKPLLGRIAPLPVWMIHGTEDEYTTSAAGRALFQATTEPKRYEEIAGANHRFDSHSGELSRALKAGLQWIASQ